MFDTIIGNPFANKHTKLQIDGKVVKRLLTEGQEALPYEYSAVLAGTNQVITHHLPAPRHHHQPNSFHWEGPFLIETLRHLHTLGLTWQGVVHTHPATAAIPSPADCHSWHYPELSYWILSLACDPPQLRLYQWRDGQFVPRDYVII